MAKVDPLVQLRDIHLPEPINWWPLAPGWYGVMVIFILIAIVLIRIIDRKKEQAKPKKQALELLKSYRQHYEKERNAQLASARISELLRRVALVYYPREQVASLHGEDWLEFLNQTSKGIDFKPVQYMLLDLPFKSVESVNLNPLFTRAELWVKQRKVPCSN